MRKTALSVAVMITCCTSPKSKFENITEEQWEKHNSLTEGIHSELPVMIDIDTGEVTSRGNNHNLNCSRLAADIELDQCEDNILSSKDVKEAISRCEYLTVRESRKIKNHSYSLNVTHLSSGDIKMFMTPHCFRYDDGSSKERCFVETSYESKPELYKCAK